MSGIRRYVRLRNVYVREMMAEFIGIFLLAGVGSASIAQSVLSERSAGAFLSVVLAWGLAVMFGVFVSGGVSGGHINPAVSVAMAVLGKFPWRKVPLYMVAQYAGAFCGAAVTYFTYHDAFAAYVTRHNETVLPTVTVFASHPADSLSLANGFGGQVMSGAILVGCVCAIVDERNMGGMKSVIPLTAGLLVSTLIMSYPYANNPAVDLGPRLFTAVAGWGNVAFTFKDYNWWWVSVLGPHVGAILGGLVYWFFIELHHPPLEAQGEEEEGEVVGETSKGSISKYHVVKHRSELTPLRHREGLTFVATKRKLSLNSC